MITGEVDNLLSCILPSHKSNNRRKEISEFITQIIQKKYGLDVFVVGTGSYTLRSYLPEADIDLVVFISPFERNEIETSSSHTQTTGCMDINNIYNYNNNILKLTLDIFTSICHEITNSNVSVHQSNNKIRNLEFINARTPLAHCIVNNVHIDITVNQIGAVATAVFLEEVDRYIGKNNLFKRSLLLVKCWCLNESRKYCGHSIMGSKNGMLSSYALSVMALYIFNKNDVLDHPFDVLRSFLCTFSTFAWDEFILTVNGLVPIGSINATKSNNPANKFEALLNQFLSKLEPVTSAAGSILIKCCNIQDPLDVRNNLSAVITINNLSIIDRALKLGYQHLESTLININNTNNSYIPVGISAHGLPFMINNLKADSSGSNKQFDNWFLRIFFPTSHALYLQEDSVRSDLCDHPLSTNEYCISHDTENTNANVLECGVDSMWTSLTKALSIMSSPISISHISSQSRPEIKQKTKNSMSRSHSPISAVSVLSDTDGGLTSGYSDCYLSDSSVYCVDEDTIEDIDAIIETSKVTGVTDNSFSFSYEIAHKQANVQTQTDTEVLYVNLNDATDTTVSRLDQPVINNTTRTRTKNKFKKKQKDLIEEMNSNRNSLPDELKSDPNVNGDYQTSSSPIPSNDRSYLVLIAKVICGLAFFIVIICSYNISLTNEPVQINNIVQSCNPPVIVTELNSVNAKISNNVISHWVKNGESITFGDKDFISVLDKLENSSNNSDSDVHLTLFQWYKDGINITEPSKSHLFVTINKMRPTDQGRYQCIVVTGKYTGLVVAETYLQISTSPVSRTKQSYQELVQGANLVLQIAADGSLPLYYKWFKNGIPIDDDISKSDKLLIYNVTKSNSGTYSCEISNFAGNYLWLEATVYVKNAR